LPRAALSKGFAEDLRGFAESLEPSAKQPAPVVSYHISPPTSEKDTYNLKYLTTSYISPDVVKSNKTTSYQSNISVKVDF
jgi:hypothetical protein